MKLHHLSGQSAGALVVLLASGAGPAWANPYECLIEPNQTVEVRSSVEGVIEKIMVKRGDRVRAGQLLVQLESSAERSAVEMARYRAEAGGRLAAAKNRFDYASKKQTRSAELHAQNFVSAQVRDESDAEKRITESELRDAQENSEMARYEYRHAQDLLNRRMLRSPFDGVVVDRMLNPGDLAEAGTGRKPILKLAQVEPLRVEVVLPLAAYGKLKMRDSAEVMPEGLGGRYTARVTVIDSVFDSASGTFGARLELPNTAGKLPAGIRCRIDFPSLQELAAKGSGPKTAAAK
ncbi:efflux RND transporter periplasmic adaptor subunit [Rhodoferax sp.]|uniref:efflux RND transporter periplasmic adaptor subunit n=1 Tax=Rhodoferax sp. TaxID=50421 RepID=UPI0025E159A5|nr:efflux RND transporter periplasmic adaptor subunit [Rhodoferax sp.]MCM2296362.1 efflux RND transporter periplasmic adaptor subunit [Rhodoferax sp.]MDD3935206.1 efflux RND transporter periplasmic adaptor subunit [Rhodoferax sp.]